MKAAPLPDNEVDRIKALKEYKLLDTLPEEVYDDITRIATEITGTPIALLSLIDSDRQWFKSRQGMGVSETPREYSFCAHAILDPDEMFIIEDARYDERFHDNPLTTGDPHVVFYAGIPVLDSAGHAFGTLCVIDSRPRTLPDNKIMALKALAKLVNVHFELRKTRHDLEQIHNTLNEMAKFDASSTHDVSEQARKLINQIEFHLASLLAGNPRPDQVSQLKTLQQTVQVLKQAYVR